MKFFKPKKIIYREEGIPYLIRWTLFECKYFAIKIHKLCSSDDACPHDHPWAFITFLLKGGYVEYSERHGSKVYSRFSLLYRPADYIHRLEIHQPVYTFVITFKKIREWGFWSKAGKWIWWRNYESKNQCE